METVFNNSFKQLDRKLDEVLRLLKANNRLDGETILDNQDLCIMLNLSKRTLQRYRALGMIAYIQIGGKPFYYEADVHEFVRKNKCNNSLPENNGI